MSQADETLEASFEFVQSEPVGATFEISANIQDLNAVHYQDSASTLWTVNHNLNKFPSVTVVDSAGNVVFGDVEYVDANNVKIKFSSAFAGKAYLN